MNNTKQEILHASRKLFNDLGYAQVTIRMIASSLGMSSGNLNYHFPKREAILEALYFEMVEAFDQRIENLGTQDISLEHMQQEIQSSMMRMIRYRFFWTDLHNLLKLCEKIRVHFYAVRQHRLAGYHFVFTSLINEKLLKPPAYPQAHTQLGIRMLDYSNTWLYVASLYEEKKKGTQLVEQASFHLLSMMQPYLTKKGANIFKSIHLDYIT